MRPGPSACARAWPLRPAAQRMQAFEFDVPAARTACDADRALGYELSRRFTGIVVHRLQATRPAARSLLGSS